jgi:nicotinamidase/pyrazinamidase
MENTPGAEYIDETRPRNGTYIVDWDGEGIDEKAMREHRNIVIRKDKFDVFTGNPYTQDIIDALRPQATVVYGVATDVCVDFAVKGLLERGIKVYVPTDAIKELPIRPLEETLNEWESLGAELVKTSDIADIVRQYK